MNMDLIMNTESTKKSILIESKSDEDKSIGGKKRSIKGSDQSKPYTTSHAANSKK